MKSILLIIIHDVNLKMTKHNCQLPTSPPVAMEENPVRSSSEMLTPAQGRIPTIGTRTRIVKVTVVFAHGHELGEGHAAVPRAVRGVEEVAEDAVLAPVAETARHHRHHRHPSHKLGVITF